jgi:hypothetical protein
MCDPMMGLSLLGSVASAAINYSQQQAAENMQNQANQEWMAYQRQKSQQEWDRQEQMRQTAENARQASVEDMSPEKQQEAQTEEEKRVEKEITPERMNQGDDAIIGDQMLSGQQGTSSQIMGDVRDRITSASRDARARIAALSTMQSYGGSQFGLQPRTKSVFAKSGQVIGLSGNERQGSLGAYQAEKAVPVARVSSSPSPWAGIASSLAGIAGKGIGGSV